MAAVVKAAATVGRSESAIVADATSGPRVRAVLSDDEHSAKVAAGKHVLDTSIAAYWLALDMGKPDDAVAILSLITTANDNMPGTTSMDNKQLCAMLHRQWVESVGDVVKFNRERFRVVETGGGEVCLTPASAAEAAAAAAAAPAVAASAAASSTAADAAT